MFLNFKFSSVAEWEGLVDSFGELLYIDCHPQVAQQAKEEYTQNRQDTLTRTTTRRSKRGLCVIFTFFKTFLVILPYYFTSTIILLFKI